MKIKRSMAFVFFSCMGMALYPVSAFAYAEGVLGVGAFFANVLMLITTLIGLLAIVAAVILAILLVRVYAVSCKNTNCKYHPRSLNLADAFDFSVIDTPGEFLIYSRDTDAADESRGSLGDPSFLLALFDESGAFRASTEDSSANTDESDVPWLDDFEPDEPRRYSSMEFTDDMIPLVLAILERQRRQAAQEQQQQRLKPHKGSGQQLRTRHPAIAATGGRRERTGEQAAVEWLVAAPVSRGRHFKAATPQLDGNEQATDERWAGVIPFMIRRAKHARSDWKFSFRRVS
ncbi:MAG: hypothetical protein LBP24_04990 [Coriobacteriales bacterium]|jgi:hypothetical protein|nr:hypothetical protein [Coriobacteriales bacterium]